MSHVQVPQWEVSSLQHTAAKGRVNFFPVIPSLVHPIGVKHQMFFFATTHLFHLHVSLKVIVLKDSHFSQNLIAIK